MQRSRSMMLCWLLALLAVLSPPAAAQDEPISVDVELSRSRVYVGDDVTYQIIVRGSDNPPTPEVEFPPQVNAQYHGRTSQSFTSMQTINGRTRTITDRRYSYQYTLTAVEAGVVRIPAPRVTIDGQEHLGEPASFEAIFPAPSDTDEIEIDIERSRIYHNETVEVEVSWWIGGQTSAFTLSSTSLPDSFVVRGLEPLPSQFQRAFDLNGEQVIGSAQQGIHQGREMTRFVFRFSITPTETGTFRLGPIRAVFTRQSDANRGYRAYAESEPVEITVLPVPSEGRPEGYRGAIGAFRLSARASNTAVNVGDPINLTLRVEGREPMVGVDQAPDIASDPAFNGRFKIASEGWRELLPRQNGVRIYQTTVRALDDEVTQIPPIRLPSFSPETGDYRIYQTQPIELSVSTVEEVTLSDAIVAGPARGRMQEAPAAPERVELTRASPGLWAHGESDELLADRGFDLGERFTRPAWVVPVVSGPVVFSLALVVAAARRASDPRAKAIRKAYRRSRALVRSGRPVEAARTYTATVLGIDPLAVTASDARSLPADPASTEALQGEMLSLERPAHHGESAPVASGADLIETLARVHRQVLRSREEASA